VISSIEQKSEAAKREIAEEYRKKIEAELKDICQNVLVSKVMFSFSCHFYSIEVIVGWEVASVDQGGYNFPTRQLYL
jgi:hypothetical protein